jgi:hypothetical protein
MALDRYRVGRHQARRYYLIQRVVKKVGFINYDVRIDLDGRISQNIEHEFFLIAR